VLDGNIKIIDPFVTGSNAFSVQLQTPEDVAEEARKMVAWRPPPPRTARKEIEPARVRVEKLGLRIRWASITLVTAPIALCMAPAYLLGARKLEPPPRNHGWTLAAIAFSTAVLFMLAGILIRR
jgi:hypothetical protein